MHADTITASDPQAKGGSVPVRRSRSGTIGSGTHCWPSRDADPLSEETAVREKGFTLIELIIVVAVIAILAAIAVPNLISSRIAANETAAAATLRALSTAEFRFKTMAVLDLNRDGSYEYGSLGELAGTANLRGSTQPITPSLMSVSLGNVDASGAVMRQGYLIRLFLPDSGGAGLAATPTNLAAVSPLHSDSAWSILAWPVSRGASGRAVFFVNQQGEILKSLTANYSGTASVPPPGAALVGVAATQIVGGELATGTVGADGNTWATLR